MKVLLVCMSGITTSILAKRLETYSEQKGYHDEFIPCRVSLSEEFINDSDVVLLAPQAEKFYNHTMNICKSFNIKVVMLDEKMFVTGQVEDIYRYLKNNAKVEKPKVQQCEKIIFNQFINIYKEVFLSCLPLVLLGMIGYCLSQCSSFSFFSVLFDATIRFINIYFAYSVGFKYGKCIQSNSYVLGIVTFVAVMMFNYGIDVQTNIYFSYISMNFFDILSQSIFNISIVCVLSLLTIFLLEILRICFRISFKQKASFMSMMSQVFVIDMVFIVFLVLRFLFYA